MAWTKEELEGLFDEAPDDPTEAAAHVRKLLRRHVQQDLEWLGDLSVERRHGGDDPVKEAIQDAIFDEYGALVNEFWVEQPGSE